MLSLKIDLINRGKVVKLSRSELVAGLVDLKKARKGLPQDIFEEVFALFKWYRADKVQMDVDLLRYYSLCMDMEQQFNDIAMITLYSNPIVYKGG